MSIQRVLPLLFALTLAVSGEAVAQHSAGGPHGLFSGSTDIGKTQPGSNVYDAASKTYRVTGGGADMWGAADDFRLSWTKVSGDAMLSADIKFGPGEHAKLEKAVLIFRQSLEPGSAYADNAIHADGHITLQYRTSTGAKTDDITAAEHTSQRLRIERSGNKFTAYTGSADGKWTSFASSTVEMQDPVYVGLGVCSHNTDGVTTANFSNVTIKQASKPPAVKK